MTADAAIYGHSDGVGSGTNGAIKIAGSVWPSVTRPNEIVRSVAPLTTAFQTACSEAANRTMRKISEDMALICHGMVAEQNA